VSPTAQTHYPLCNTFEGEEECPRDRCDWDKVRGMCFRPPPRSKRVRDWVDEQAAINAAVRRGMMVPFIQDEQLLPNSVTNPIPEPE
tara:strand:- start:705 stop:965 length:261 start_codon:yes stop_codon:yes gene_type:complete